MALVGDSAVMLTHDLRLNNRFSFVGTLGRRTGARSRFSP
jgi:hypothetical protein